MNDIREIRCVAITGATSMLGASTINAFIKRGIKVLALVRNGSEKKHRLPTSEYIEVIECDLDKLNSLSINRRCDVLIHFGWDGADHKGRSNAIVQTSNIQYSIDSVILAEKLGCSLYIGAGSQLKFSDDL